MLKVQALNRHQICSWKVEVSNMIVPIIFPKFKAVMLINNINDVIYESLFIIIFQEGKYINEKKDRVTMMHIENFIKPLYLVFPTDSFNFFFTSI